ncbi:MULTISPECIES: ATP-dependent nuclease [Enterococcus]|uniref:AAA family ATPase n=1 Tax=Enterococcus raffinosus TaxID=71452 RepID=A0AAW8T0G4_9ENTE|nr:MULTISPECIES: AAA family ATPase [Enterococcus]MDH5037970.1 AAA family ATPase [Enterococcus faecalis]MDT2434041.1 AAA family ATPase [Enterococcus avium]MDT2508416.1 AAA family ATPase [Enterococcus avium]MDT2542738.1 AAA family ATPase [Enterococcus raffinosus]MDV7741074.1 AAA family ATPase [Enterococcus gallinarum]
MKLTQLKLENFRSFGPFAETIDFNSITGLIGHNSAGKTAILSAIRVLLGNLRLKQSDFHCVNEQSIEHIEMKIEARFDFFDSSESQEECGETSIPTFFETLTIQNEGENPYIRIVLDAKWTPSNSPEGDIDSSISFITSSDDDTKRVPMTAFFRSKIDVIYIPAIRNPYEQLNNAAGTILWRLLKQINWKESDKLDISQKIDSLDRAISDQDGISLIEETISAQWKIYHNDNRFSDAKIKFGSTDLNKILKKLEVEFSPGPHNRSYKIGDLGDGLQSLFYFSLIDAFLKTEEKGLKEISKNIDENDRTLNVSPPELTILLVEEPENHINPQLLGNALSNLRSISKNENSQVVFTSHNPSVVKRIDPEEIRHVRMESLFESSVVNKLVLPDRESDAYKYVKNAVIAYPELYFSSLIILGEGDSEEIIIPFFLKEKYPNLDSVGISVVPLGGRHVNHFWRLLNQLQIPYITLLDFDLERYGGGWSRIKYALKELIKIDPAVGEVEMKNSKTTIADIIDNLDKREDNNYKGWLNFLKESSIYYSYPLDVDFLMLENYKNDYIETLSSNEGPFVEIGGKRIKMQNISDEEKTTEEFKSKRDVSIRNTLKEHGGSGEGYSDTQKELMIWYDYFFLGRGKPVTHRLALNDITCDSTNTIPTVFQKMIIDVKEKLSGDSND